MLSHRYLVAVIAVIGATGALLALAPVVDERFPLLVYFAATLFVHWTGGLGPALCAGCLSVPLAIAVHLFLVTDNSLLTDLTACVVFLLYAIAKRPTQRAPLRGLASKAVEESTHRLSMFLDNSTSVAWMKDIQGRYVYVNEPFAARFPDFAENRLGLTDWEAWPEIASTLIANDQQVLSLGKPIEYTEDVPTPDGVLHKWRVYKFPFAEEDGTRYVGGIAFDITDHFQREEALRRSEARTRRIVESNMIGICFAAVTGQLEDANDAFLEIVGFTREDLDAGKIDWRVITPPEHFERDEKALREIAATGSCTPFEKDYIRKDGSRVPILIGVAKLDDPWRRNVAFVLDLTERKRAEVALIESERRFSLFMKHLPGFAHMKDEKLRITYLNEAYGDILPQYQERCIGKTGEEIFPPATAAQVRANDEWVLANNATLKTFEDIPLPDGLHRYLVYKFPIPQQTGGRLIGGISIDMTDLLRAEEERRRLQEQIQQTQKLESLGVLAGGIAHDFNNLLMGILGHASLALEEMGPGAPGSDSIQQIETAALRAAELTKQMLAYSGRGKFVIEPVHVSSLVEEMSRLLRVSISKTAEIACHLDPELPMIEADVGQIRQIVMNLIVNASDAIGEREGKITLRTGTIDAKRADLESAYMPEVPPEGKYIFIEVSDDGIGMDAETRSRIFEPFFTTKMTGRGLGLAAVLGIVRGHHGAIECDSQLGKGTTFRVLLPVPAVVPNPAERNNGRKLTLKSVKGTVLIVDDDETVRLIACRIVERMGFQVLLAVDGRDGLDVFREHARQITVVLLDMTMPRMNGDEALERMRQIDPSVPIILTSGYNETEISGRFAGNGPAGFIQKPYRPRELYEKLASVLQLRNEGGNQPG